MNRPKIKMQVHGYYRPKPPADPQAMPYPEGPTLGEPPMDHLVHPPDAETATAHPTHVEKE